MSRVKGEADAPVGSFEEQVMLAVLRLPGDAYGMTIVREIESLTGREVAIGAVYTTLDRLEAKRMVSSSRGTVDEVSRRLFAVTARGGAALVQTHAMRERMWAGVDLRKLSLASAIR